jgi:diacylglycerol kinase family enzyme
MQAAAAMVGTDVPLGLVPGGTGNVLAGNLRIPSRPVPAAHMITRGRSRPIDLGRLDRDDGHHYFAVACGAGADAAVMGGTPHSAKQRLGMGGYWRTLFQVVPEIRSSDVALTIDGRRIEARAAVTLVLNCREVIPPLLRVVDGTEIDDGLLDVLVLAADTPWQCARGMWRAVQNVVLGTGPPAYLQYARGEQITIESATVQPVQFDGDLAGTTPAVIRVVPRAIRVMVNGGR